jgi:hypothetical protein
MFMPMTETFHIKITLPIIVVVFVVFGFWMSLYTQDPHWMNRSGALVAAVAALAILLQIRAELRLEHEREELDAKRRNGRGIQEIATPLDDLEDRLAVNRLEIRKRQIAQRRLAVASFVVASTILGELLHGFGDLLVCHSVAVCANQSHAEVSSHTSDSATVSKGLPAPRSAPRQHSETGIHPEAQ